MKKLNIKSLTAALVNRGGGALAGGAAGRLLNEVMPESTSPIVITGIKIAIGALAPELAPKIKMLDYAGAGLVGQASGEFTNKIVNDLKAKKKAEEEKVEGIGSEQEFPMDEDAMSGTEEVETLSGIGNENFINGNDDDDDDDFEME